MGESLINALNFLYFNLKGRFKIERPLNFYNSSHSFIHSLFIGSSLA